MSNGTGLNLLFNPKRDWIWIVLLGLLVQGFWAARLQHPSYMDAYYYTTSAQRLAAGDGFTTPVIWQFLDNPTSLPAPSHTYWMPLPSLLAAGGYLFGDSFRWAQLPFWLLAGLLPWLSYIITQKIGGERWQSIMAAMLTAWGGYYAAYLSQPSTFAPYAWIGGLGLLFFAQAVHTKQTRYWFYAGIFAGLAHLTRADGILFLLLGFGLAGLNMLRHIKFDFSRELKYFLTSLAVLMVGYLLIMLPWFSHNVQVIGRPLPTVGSQTAYLTNYNDLFAFGRTFTLAAYLEWGLANILQSKLEALWLTIQTFIAVTGLIFLFPFVIIGWISASRKQAVKKLLSPLGWYIAAFLGAMVVVFTFPAGRGSVLHSSASFWPWMMPLAALGLGATVDWMAAKLPHWEPPKAKRMFAAMFIMVGFIISPLAAGNQPLWREEANTLQTIGSGLPDDAVIMMANPPMMYYHTGLASISIPNEPIEIVLKAAAQFGVTHLIVDGGHTDFLEPIYEGSAEVSGLSYLTEYELDEGKLRLFSIDEASND